MHCDHAFYVGATPRQCRRAGRAGAHAGRARRQGVPGLLHRRLCCSTTRRTFWPRLKAGQPPRRGPFRGRRPPDRAQSSRANRRPRATSDVARRRSRALRPSGVLRLARRGRPRRACAARHHRRRDRAARRRQGYRHRRDHAAASDAGRAGVLRAAGHLRADEPADPRREPSRRAVGGGARRA